MSESMTKSKDDECTSVRVAVRIRPQLPRERIEGCRVCTSVAEQCQINIKDRCFTYDHVFNITSAQDDIYNESVRPLIDGCFEGYNATVFAYGQTGSGKTYSMGTGFDVELPVEEMGVIPRAVEHLFQGIQQREQEARDNGIAPPEFRVTAQFMELYNEEIIDLGDPTRDPDAKMHKSRIKIHEDACGGIYLVGITVHPVTSLDDTIKCLKVGALSRSTASTNMNVQSSRSHAIFSLHIKQSRLVTSQPENDDPEKESDSTQESAEFETLTAKFHFVDLAGSERLKRTGAIGERQKEGIAINSGLLALGNVISALGDKTKKGSHVPYRDSKLSYFKTLYSRTLMIACVSPSDCDFVETLTTLKYANRARNIQNKVVANQDKASRQLAELRQQIMGLQLELNDYKSAVLQNDVVVNQDKASRQLAELRQQIMGLQLELNDYKSGKNLVDADGVEYVNDMFHENSMLQKQNDDLRTRLRSINDTIEMLKTQNCRLIAERDALTSMDGAGEIPTDIVEKLSTTYLSQIADLEIKIYESESTIQALRRAPPRSPRSTSSALSVSMTSTYLDLPTSPRTDVSALLSEARNDVRKMKKQARFSENSETPPPTETEKPVNDEKPLDDVEESEKTDEEPEMDEEQESGDADEDDIMADSSDSDNDNDKTLMNENLAEITCDISIKEKLIDELEKSQKHLQGLKQQYEDKLTQLQHKIKTIESERDTVLANVGHMESNSAEKSKKIKDQYEKKLSDLQNEVKKLNVAKKEHAKQMKNQGVVDRQLKSLQSDLQDMKNTKVRLMKQIKEEADKTRKSETRRTKEIAQMKKDQRLKENMIKSLEADKRQKDIKLRRKHDEVETLRKQNKPMSSKTAGRVGKYNKPVTVPVAPVKGPTRQVTKRFSPKAAKHKWDSIEKSVSCSIIKKQTLAHIEKDMENWLKEREKLSQKLSETMQRRARAQTLEQTKELDDISDSIQHQISYTQENIDECQLNIVDREETKVEGEIDVAGVIEKISLAEAKYLIEHFLDNAVTKGLAYAQKSEEARGLAAKIHQSELNNTLQQDLLRHMIGENLGVDGSDSERDGDEESPPSSLPSSPVDSVVALGEKEGSANVTTEIKMDDIHKLKARRRTATTQELLYSVASESTYTVPLLPIVSTHDTPSPSPDIVQSNLVTSSSNSMPPPKLIPTKIAATATSTRNKPENNKPDTKRTTPDVCRLTPEPSPVLKRNNSFNILDRAGRSSSAEPNGSPQMFRRTGSMRGGDNVFSRLTSSTNQGVPPRSHKGRIDTISTPLSLEIGKRDFFLSCEQVASGHTKPVLGLDCTDDFFVSCSQDRTAKLWDIEAGKEIQSWFNHPNSVTCVRYNEDMNLVFTVCQSNVHVWDTRQASQKCVTLLNSSGLSYDATSTPLSVTASQEPQITNISLNPRTNQLFMAVGSTVRIWDVGRFNTVGKLTTGHQAPVMVLGMEDQGDSSVVITGSKDHYIKVFKLPDTISGSFHPKCTLEPPHYDGIQSLAIQGETLFSGSRDNSIKKWDLNTNKLVQSLNAAHKDWVSSLNILPESDVLVSTCRSGIIKIWNIDNGAMLGEVKGHQSAINAVMGNSMLVFTASSDTTIGIWTPAPKNDSDVITID